MKKPFLFRVHGIIHNPNNRLMRELRMVKCYFIPMIVFLVQFVLCKIL